MFEGAYLKLERAKQHIRDLEAVCKAYVDTRPYGYRIHGKADKWARLTVSVYFTESMPSGLGVVLGDVVHNLRSALDHAVWELIGLDAGTQDRFTKLPSGDDRISFEASARGTKTPRQDTKDFLVHLAIYPDGRGDPLHGLNLLNNADKHRIITPVARSATVSGIATMDLKTGQRFEVGPVASDPDTNDNIAVFTGFPGHGIDANQEFQLSFEICFGETDAFPEQPVIPTLLHLAEAVNGTLGQFALFVRTRT